MEVRDTVEASDITTALSPGLVGETGPDPSRWGILAVVVVAQLMIVLDASIVTIALPSAQHALHISTANRQWVITAYTLAFGGLLLLGGRIADFSGRKRMFVVGLLGFAGASALGGLAVNEAMLFAARALQGAFAALMAPAALSILTITFQHDAKERAKAFGAYGAVSGAGGAIGVLLGGSSPSTRPGAGACWSTSPSPSWPPSAAVARRAREPGRGHDPLRRAGRGPLHARTGQPGLRLHQGGKRRVGLHGHHHLAGRRPASSWPPSCSSRPRRATPCCRCGWSADRNRGGAFLASLLTGAGLFAMFVFLSYYLQGVLHYSALKAGLAFLPFAFGIIVAAGRIDRPRPADRPADPHDASGCSLPPVGWPG